MVSVNVLYYFFLNIIVSILIYIVLYYVTVSDFVKDKTGHVLFYKNEHGMKVANDYIRILYFNVLAPLLFAYLIWFLYYLTSIDFLFYGSLLYAIINLYFAILLLLRLKYFFYMDEPKNLTEREAFKNYTKNNLFLTLNNITNDENMHVVEYLYYGKSNVGLSMVFVLYMGLFLLTGVPEILLFLVVLLIYMHLMIFPDYLNKLWMVDIRTSKGLQFSYVLLGIILSIGFLILLIIRFSL